MYNRLIPLEKIPKRSFFLWGPRQAGKSTLLRKLYPNSLYIDLLKSDDLMQFTQHPELLRTQFTAGIEKHPVIIDEVQKVPMLLDEVHWLIENRGLKFVLCGSSARKLKRGRANLLGGRALRFELRGLVSQELAEKFDLLKLVNQGNLPEHYDCDPSEWRPLMRSYIGDYLKEEIAAEAVVKNLPAFTGFLEVAALSDTEAINFSTIARDVGVSGHTVKEYFEILVETMLGNWVPAYTKRPKRRTRESPKFYFCNTGIVNVLAKRGELAIGSELFGKAFENWLFQELYTCLLYAQNEAAISYWRLSSGIEVDFVLGDLGLAIEAKATAHVRPEHLKGLRELQIEYPAMRHLIVVCLETRVRKTEDGILIYPFQDFLKALWRGEIFSPS